MASNVPQILQISTGTPEIDMLRDVQVASHQLSPDYYQQAQLIARGIEMSDVTDLLGKHFLVTVRNFIPQSPEALRLQKGELRQFNLTIQLLGKLAGVGDYFNPNTRSRIILLGFDDIEMMSPVSEPDDLDNQVDPAVHLEACRRGGVDVPCLAVTASTSAEWEFDDF